jgi:arylsulfatase A-like enzyme
LRVPETLPPLPANHAPAADEPAFIGMCRERAHYGPENTHTVNWSAEDWQRYLSAYYRYTEEVDAHIGTVLDALRASGREDDTLVVYMSDHGEGMAAHQWVVKLMFWENVVGIPLIVRWPGRIPAGAVSNTLVSQLDLVPTLCDYAGAPLPDGCPGLSLRGALEGGKPAGREAVLVELQTDPEDLGVKGRMVVTERYKYGVFSLGERPELLFDLQSDPGETLNLAFDPAFAAVRDDHRRLLRDAIARTPDTPGDYPALR